MFLLMAFALSCTLFWDRIPRFIAAYKEGGGKRRRVLAWCAFSIISTVLWLKGF